MFLYVCKIQNQTLINFKIPIIDYMAHLEKVPSDFENAKFKIKLHSQILRKAKPKADKLKKNIQEKGKIEPEILR